MINSQSMSFTVFAYEGPHLILAKYNIMQSLVKHTSARHRANRGLLRHPVYSFHNWKKIGKKMLKIGLHVAQTPTRNQIKKT